MQLERLATTAAALAVVALAAACGTGSSEPVAAPSSVEPAPNDWHSRPSNDSVPPTSTGALAIIVDAQTGATRGMGTNPPLDLATLGPVKTLHA